MQNSKRRIAGVKEWFWNATFKLDHPDFQKGLRRALKKIHRRQTLEEKNHLTTTEDNGVGFNKPDAHRCCKLVEKLKHSDLDLDDYRYLAEVLPKYARQLL